MTKFLQAIVLIMLLAGCQNQTGYHSVDPWVVKNYKDRVILTQYLEKGVTYCSFGAECMTICTMVPEPKNLFLRSKTHWDRYNALGDRFYALKKRAESHYLLLDLPKVEQPVIEIMSPPAMADQMDIERVQLKCMRDQQYHLDKIEQLLERLNA